MKKQKTTITNIEDIEKMLTSTNDADVKVGQFLLNKADVSDPQTAGEIQKLINKVRPDQYVGIAQDTTLGYILIINDKRIWGKNGVNNRFSIWQSKGSPKSNFTTWVGHHFKWTGRPGYTNDDKFVDAYRIFKGDAKAYTKFLATHGVIKTYELIYNAVTNAIYLRVC